MMDEKIELSDIEIQQIKEQNQERIKKVVAYVAISLTVISIILVALSLSFGPKIDSLVNDQLDQRLITKQLILGPNPNISTS
uniref:Col_cuticle_N domain-containing protein n=2 Tax=Strongyloides TaxID=6247 RepID=A0A0K0F7D9_STRVS